MKKLHIFAIFLIFAIAGFLVSSLVRGWNMNSADPTFGDLAMEGGLLTESVTVDGTAYLVPPDQLFDVGVNAETSPALDETSFVSVEEADTILADEVHGVIVPFGTVARFYSYQILNWHEVVNETIGDQKLAVTHCVLCRSSVVYDRVVDGRRVHL